ncbi:hypothetical protein [Carnobacterium pleistocenium]|uniref:hypothetical protein n=1 Tax=Carnobacterium pleistocenium TaxID=181073 RepID=UPI00055218E1|nr:hypothetical protein [Carnobacterium pleistocenium]
MFYRILSTLKEKDYLKIIECLKDFSTEMVIVEYPVGNNTAMKIKTKLNEFKIETKWLTKWPGTKLPRKKTKAKADIYNYNKFSYNALKNSTSLISEEQEKDIDVFFLKNRNCIFFSVIHEDIHVITDPKLAENIKLLGYKVDKIPTFNLSFV